MKVDCVRIIEAGYAPAVSERGWMAAVLEAFDPLVRDMGAMARIIDFALTRPAVGEPVARGNLSDAVGESYRAMLSFLAEHRPDALRMLLDPDPSVVCWTSHRRARLPPEVVEETCHLWKGPRPWDSLGILSAEPAGPSLVVTVPYSEEVAVPPRTVHQISRATAHLCTAMRLRRRAGGAEPAATGEALGPDVEAIMDPSGKVQHARGAAEGKQARATLTGAVRNVERARGRLRRTDPEEALEIWRALFDGRWSVVEHVESDGRRYLLARRNEPGAPDPKALTQGERDALACAARGHSNKYIGWLLGVAPNTVATRLESALRKLGVATRREAIALLGRGTAQA